jgi:hypothetical protein
MDLFVVPTMGFDLLSAGYITNTSESKFSVHTGRPAPAITALGQWLHAASDIS